MNDGPEPVQDPVPPHATLVPVRRRSSESPSRSPSSPRIGRSAFDLWPYALITFLYLATSPFHQGLNNPNEMVRVYMTKALVDDRTPVIDGVVRAWGGVDDKAKREGRLYSSKAPLQSLIGVPIYAAARELLPALSIPLTRRTVTTALRIFGSALFGVVFSSLLLRFARRRALELGAPRPLGTAVGLGLALGTMLYPYALTFTGHLLAALCAGGSYFVALALARATPGTRRFTGLGMLAGFLAGNAPFAEYPSALVAAPALAGALVVAPTARARVALLGTFALGGLPPFALGLWAHADSWGSPFKTGYSFLENVSYVELHGKGFFGVTAPKAEAFAGALFSPGTGLFFFSPILLLGLAAMVHGAFRRAPEPEAEAQGFGPAAAVHRALAIAGLVGFVLSVLFISGHRGWRGGWTVGPRYIIAVAPLLGLWTIEALRVPALRSFAAALAAVSIGTTGFAAALYPHLSDVFTHPLKTFLLPSYLRGESTYGIAHALGLSGHVANAVHALPLFAAMLYAAVAGVSEAETRRRRATVVATTLVAAVALMAAIPEGDPAAAALENRRLWGFWEPARSGHDARLPEPEPPAMPFRPPEPEPPGLLFRASRRWREVSVERVDAAGTRTPCTREPGERCKYGQEGWQHFGPEMLEIGGERVRLLYLHPVQGSRVRAELPTPPNAQRAIVRYALTDGSAASSNPSPVRLRLARGSTTLREASAPNRRGLEQLEVPLTGGSTAALALELTVEQDGARVFGFDVDLIAE